jgi:xanthine dehydrogenase accessory factor
MDSVGLEVLRGAIEWRRQGYMVWLATVVETWGSAPRQPGALMALNGDGRILGSVSGGCVEDDLIARVRSARGFRRPEIIAYGVSREEAARFGIPCGGTLKVLVEPVRSVEWIEEILVRTQRHELVAREFDIENERIALRSAMRGDSHCFDGVVLTTVFGPRWRLLLIGAGPTSRMLAEMAKALDFEVLICDPREEYAAEWRVPGVRLVPGMPDDVVLEIEADAHTAIVALTHDPKLDDMALLEALKSSAFYVGALGSRVSQKRRHERLKLFDLSDHEIGRLHGPVGLPIGSRTPGEIAVSVLAEIIAVKNGAMYNVDANTNAGTNADAGADAQASAATDSNSESGAGTSCMTMATSL